MKIISGTLDYISHKPELYGQRRGYERFTFLQHMNGDISLNATCVILEPSPEVQRIVYYRVDKDRNPIEACVNVRAGTRDLGTAFYKFSPDKIDYITRSASGDLTQKQVKLDEPLRWFGTHPLSADAFNLRSRHKQLSAGGRNLLHSYLTAIDVRGEGEPGVEDRYINCEFIGHEQIDWRGETLGTLHYRFIGLEGDPEGHPPYDIWVTDDEIGLLVKAGCGGHMLTHYELNERTVTVL